MLRSFILPFVGTCLIAWVAIAVDASAQFAVDASSPFDLDLTLNEYMGKAGADVKLVPPGELKIDGYRMLCGRRPTVIDPNFDSWGGAYPGFVILNTKRLEGLPTPVKLYVFAHECGHQFIGRDEEEADCFAVKRGRRYGWLTKTGMEEICGFISKLKGSWDHLPGPKRCKQMQQCFKDAAPRQSRANRQ